MGLNQTPKGERLHIALFGKRNAGKSSLIKAILRKLQEQSRQMRADGKTQASFHFSGKELEEWGELTLASGLIVSYINQDTSFFVFIFACNKTVSVKAVESA